MKFSPCFDNEKKFNTFKKDFNRIIYAIIKKIFEYE